MEFKSTCSSVLKAISKVIGAVNKNSASEYLSALKISITKEFLVEATNMDLIISSWFEIPEGGVIHEGSFCVDAFSLFEIIKKLPKDQELHFHIEKQAENLEYLIIQTGKSKFDLATLKVENYPSLTTASVECGVKFENETLSFLIDKTKNCIYTSETRYNINGLLFHFEAESSKVFAVATDGHRLGYATAENSTILQSGKYTIPRKVVLEIKKILENEEGETSLDVSKNKITFNFANSRLTTKLIDAEFPDYQRVIPKDYTEYFSVNAKQFLASIDKVSSVYLNATNEIGVRLTVSPSSLKISSIKDINKGFDELPAIFTKEGEIEIMCNFLYLKEVLSSVDSQTVQIFVKDATFPVMVQDSENAKFFYIIMPMKI